MIQIWNLTTFILVVILDNRENWLKIGQIYRMKFSLTDNVID